MRLRTIGTALALTCLTLGRTLAQTPAPPSPILHNTFEDDTNGWQAMGASAKLTRTQDTANVKEGKSALQFDYTIAKDEINLLFLPTPNGALAKMKSLKFWVKTSHAVPLVVALQEKDGGRYLATFTTPVDQWQRVELNPADFTLSIGPNEPKDPDNRLDLDQVEGIGLVDMGQFVFAGSEEVAKLFNVQTGAHRLYLDDFVVSAEELPDATETVKDEFLLDKFTRPQLGWIVVGEAFANVAKGKPMEGSSLQADYRQAPGKLIGLVRPVATGKLAGKGQLIFTAASTKSAHLIVQVEEYGGGKYNTTITVPGNTERKEFRLAFVDFKAADDSKDSNNKLDLDQVHQILIIDASGLLDRADQDNTLWINGIRATK